MFVVQMVITKGNQHARDVGSSKKKRRKSKSQARLDWSLVEPTPEGVPREPESARALSCESFFVVATPVRFWMIEFKKQASHLSHNPLPCPYALSIPIQGLQFGAATRTEVRSARHPEEWFVLAPSTVWKCREIRGSNFAPGLQAAWLSAFLAAHGVFPLFRGLRCMVRPQKRGAPAKPCFSLAVGMRRYQQDLSGALSEPGNQNTRFFRLMGDKCIQLVKKLSSPEVGCLYTDYKPSNFVVDLDRERPSQMDLRLIDAEPGFTFVAAEAMGADARRHLLQANLFFWYVNFWSLAESVEMPRGRHLEYRRALRTAVEPYFAEPSAGDGGFRRLLVNLLLDSSKYNLYSPLSILRKYFFWRMEHRDLTEKVKARMRLLLATWPVDTRPGAPVAGRAGGARGGQGSREWVSGMVGEIIWCSCFPTARE